MERHYNKELRSEITTLLPSSLMLLILWRLDSAHYQTWLGIEPRPEQFSSHWPVSPNIYQDVSGLHVSHLKRQVFCFFPFLLTDSFWPTLLANRPVASPFIRESSCFWSESALLMQWDLSALLCVHPLLCEIWHDRNCRGFKPEFVTLLTQERNMDFDFRLWGKTQQENMFV